MVDGGRRERKATKEVALSFFPSLYENRLWLAFFRLSQSHSAGVIAPQGLENSFPKRAQPSAGSFRSYYPYKAAGHRLVYSSLFPVLRVGEIGGRRYGMNFTTWKKGYEEKSPLVPCHLLSPLSFPLQLLRQGKKVAVVVAKGREPSADA